jgi:hypothetical protein
MPTLNSNWTIVTSKKFAGKVAKVMETSISLGVPGARRLPKY